MTNPGCMHGYSGCQRDVCRSLGQIVAALQSYSQMVGDQFLQDMENPSAGLNEIAEFWSRFEHAARQPGWCGCLIMRTAAGRIATEPEVAAEIKAFLDRLSAAFKHALLGAMRCGDFPSDALLLQTSASQAFAIAVACSTIGVFEGFTPRIADMIAAGSAACRAPCARLTEVDSNVETSIATCSKSTFPTRDAGACHRGDQGGDRYAPEPAGLAVDDMRRRGPPPYAP